MIATKILLMYTWKLQERSLSNADRDLLTTMLSYLKKLHGPVVSNLDRDLLRDVSSKLDMVLMNQRRILNEIFPGEAVIERPENCPPLPLRDERSFQTFNKFLKDKIAFSQFLVKDICLFQTNYLNAHIVDNSEQWNAAIRLMSIVLYNEFARLISWKGTKGVKISFYGTRIKEALF
ncbi:ancient domain protein 2, partial [Lasius niger]